MPQQAPIAVLDALNHQLLVPLFRGARYAVIDLDGKEIFCSPLVMMASIWHYLRCRSVKAAYAMAVLRWIKPAIVVTYIDNNHAFHQAARFSPGIRFLAIQNGGRLLDRDHPPGSPQIYLKEFACLGRYEIDQYTRHGAHVEKFYPVGTLNDAYYRDICPAPPRDKAFDLCLVSQVRLGMQQRFTERLDGFAMLVEFVGRFSKKHGKTLCVAMRMHPDRNAGLYEWERAWYQERLGSEAQLFGNKPGSYNTYSLADRSRVTLGMHSTAMREAFGRGDRIISCNFSGNPTYDFPVPGLWVLSTPDYAAFEARLLRLLEMSDAEYAAACGDAPSYLIGYDPQRPSLQFLGDLIAEAIQSQRAGCQRIQGCVDAAS